MALSFYDLNHYLYATKRYLLVVSRVYEDRFNVSQKHGRRKPCVCERNDSDF